MPGPAVQAPEVQAPEVQSEDERAAETAGEKGTAPVGGTTGAVDAPSSGGEELVRRLARPRGGASNAMVDLCTVESNSAGQPFCQ